MNKFSSSKMNKFSSVKMKLLFVTEFFPSGNQLKFTGGVEAYNYYLFRELAKKHQVTVICRRGIERFADQKQSWGIKIIRVGKKQSRIDTNFTTLPDRVLFIFQSFIQGLKLDFDLVQGNNFISYPSAFLLGKVKRKPTLAWYPDVFIGQWISLVGLVSGLLGELTERLYLNLSWKHIISLSGSTTQKLIEQKINPDNITTIYGGVDFKFFSQAKAQKNKNFTIICISRMVVYKRLDLLIRAAAILQKKGINFQVEIIGSGPEDFSLKLLAQELNVQKKINFRDNLSRQALAQSLKKAHLFCLPSEQEGFGLVVIEAAAAKLPYVISNLNVLKEITYNGQGGLFFKKGNTQDLAEKIRKLIINKKIRDQLSLDAYALAQKYSWELVAHQFEQVYLKQITKQVKVVMIVDAWFPHVGGGQIHVLELARRLSQRGYDLTVLSRNLGESGIVDENFKVVLLGKKRAFANPLGRLEFLCLALAFCLQHNFDIYHAHAFSPGLIIPFVKFFKNGKTIFTVHGKGARVAGIKINLNVLEDLVVYKIPYDLEISVAKSTIIKQVAAKRLITIPNGVNVDNFKPAIKVRRKIKNILFVGRLSEEKGVDLLIEAFKNINQNINLVIVGEGPEFKNLHKLANSKIRFLGKLTGTSLIAEYKKADLLVLPSRTEGHPLTLFEGWASKLPVLATGVGDNKNYIKDGINGFLAEPSVNSIKNAILKTLKSKSLNQIGEKGYKDVQNYSWDKIVDLTEKAYKNTI